MVVTDYTIFRGQSQVDEVIGDLKTTQREQAVHHRREHNSTRYISHEGIVKRVHSLEESFDYRFDVQFLEVSV